MVSAASSQQRVVPSPADTVAGTSIALPAHDDLACLILSAGLGTRMRPFTATTPKPLLTVANEDLLSRAISQASIATRAIAVNVFHLADSVAERLALIRTPVHISREAELMGTAGAVACIRDWLGGRDLLLLNGDTWLGELSMDFVSTWDRERPRLLVKEAGYPSDFGRRRFVGASLLPGGMASSLAPTPSGIYKQVWLPNIADLDLVVTDSPAFDCGTPDEFIMANLAVSGLPAVIHPTARPRGAVIHSVLLRDSTTEPGSCCVGEIRDGWGNRYVSQAPELVEPAALCKYAPENTSGKNGA